MSSPASCVGEDVAVERRPTPRAVSSDDERGILEIHEHGCLLAVVHC